MKIGYLGPPGTFSHQALLAELPRGAEPVPLATLYDTVMAVQDGAVQRALVPIENSLEGSVDITLDTLAIDAPDVRIVGELVHPIRNCLIAAQQLSLEEVATVFSHPQPNAQCARFLRTQLPHATVIATSSTAEAVRHVAAQPGTAAAALGSSLAAELYGGTVVLDGVDDASGNETRFVWLERGEDETAAAAATKTSIVFWGAGDESPGWLVACLSELSDREISLTRIESRPRRVGLGHYMFFADFAGAARDPAVAEAIAALGGHCEQVRVLGSYAAA
jgi:prephenate dehydratase